MLSSLLLRGFVRKRTGWARNKKLKTGPTLALGVYTGGQFQPRALALQPRGGTWTAPWEQRLDRPRRSRRLLGYGKDALLLEAGGPERKAAQTLPNRLKRHCDHNAEKESC